MKHQIDSQGAHSACPFCESARQAAQTEHFYIQLDAYPVTVGHILVIAKRHVSDYFSLNEHEKVDLPVALNVAHEYINQRHQVDGFNIGMNCGQAAGQTVHHMHCHLIPRRSGDMDDPRGGVRGVMPSRQKY